jgi:hypothetical protein
VRPEIERALEVAARQAHGEGFNKRATDKEVVDALLAGSLTLRPHAEWRLPEKLRWDADPFGELNWQAQFNMLRWLDPLRRQAEGNDAARNLWLDVVTDWINANIDSPQTRWATDGMVAGIRGLAILNGLALADDPGTLIRGLDRHVEWLADEANHAIGNHALWQITSLFVLASALGKDGERDVAIGRFERHISEEYDDEGVNAEGSLAYHLYNYRWARDALRRFELEGVRLPSVSDRLQGALREIVHGTRPDGLLERIGDTENAPLAGVTSPEVRYVRSGGEHGEPPQELSAVFTAGFAFGRTGWGETKRALVDETFYSLRFGRANRVHGHQDGGSLTYFAGGGPVLIDSGKYGYNSSEMRRHINSRRAHNVVDVQGEPYSRASDVRLVASASADSFESYALVDEGYRGARLVREVVFSRPGEWLLVADEVTGSPSGAPTARWHVDPSFEAVLENQRVKLHRGTGAIRDFAIVWTRADQADIVAGAENPYEGWSSTGWNTAVPVPVLRLVLPVGEGRCVTLVAPADDDGPEVTVDEGRHGVLVTVTAASRRSWVVLRNGLAPHLFDTYPDSWDSAVADGVSSSGAEDVSSTAVETAEAVLTDVRSAIGLRDPAPDIERIGKRLRSLGFGGSWDYGFGSVLADTGLRADGFEPRRDPLTKSELCYRGTTYRTLRHGSLPHSVPADPAVHVFELGPITLAGLLTPRAGDVLFVALSGAVDRGRTSLPLFQGIGVHAELPGPSMFFSDPTLELDADLRLGWYLGTAHVDVHAAIARIAERVASSLGVRKVVLVGGSGGGFAAIQIASFLPGATAVAFSPQTSVTAYHPRFSDHTLRAVFGSSGPSSDDTERLDATTRYAKRRVPANVHYIQNSGDAFHVERHVAPFVAALEKSPLEGRFHYEEVPMGKGHVSPARDAYVSAVLAAVTDI